MSEPPVVHRAVPPVVRPRMRPRTPPGPEPIRAAPQLGDEDIGDESESESDSDRPDFDGETYVRERDQARLHAQLTRVFDVMRDHAWHTLGEIEATTGDPQASISARLRDLRKDKFGGYVIVRHYIERGLFEYRLEEIPTETLDAETRSS